MNFELRKKVFFKDAPRVKTSVSLPTNVIAHLKELQKITGQSVNSLICMALEDFLLGAVEEGLMKSPKGEEATVKELLTQRSSRKP